MDNTERFPVIVNADLSGKEKEKLLVVLSKHRKALGYSMKDVKGIHPSIYSHAIPIVEGADTSNLHHDFVVLFIMHLVIIFVSH